MRFVPCLARTKQREDEGLEEGKTYSIPGPHSLSMGIHDICDVSSLPTVNQQVQGIRVARGS